MNFTEYDAGARATAIYPNQSALAYLALGLNGEAGEVAEHIKKHLRDKTPLDTYALAHELGDVLWYLSQLAWELGVDLEWVAEKNLRKLADRKERDAIGGSGDNR